MVIAIIRRVVRWRELRGPSAIASGKPRCRWGRERSSTIRKKEPDKKPVTTIRIGGNGVISASSIAGRRRDHMLAAIMTPPAKPSVTLRILRLILSVVKTYAAPSAVSDQVNNPARNAAGRDEGN
jgi:hypothetical protein